MLYELFWGHTIYGMLQNMEELYGGRPLFSWKEEGEIRSADWHIFCRDVRRLAGWFVARDLTGCCIVIDGRNRYEQITALFAAAAAGAVAAPLSFDLSVEDLSDLMGRIGPALVIYDRQDEDILPEATRGCAPRLLPDTGGAESVRGILESNCPLLEHDPVLSPTQAALLLATSGSTSRSKLVLLSHYALLPHSEVLTQRSLFVLPIYHIAALNVLANDMARGVPVCLSTLGRGLADFHWFHPRDIFGVPGFVDLIVQRHRAGKLSLEGMNSINSGGAPQNEATAQYLRDLGIFSMSLYGATETAGMVDYSTPAHFRAGSVGLVGPWNQIRISQSGEVLVKGPNVLLRYLGDPKSTAEVLQDGWYATGDTGYFDADGFLFITGRIRNIIVLPNGENVSPEAVEARLGACDDIQEVIVYGEADHVAAQVWCGAPADQETRDRVQAFVKNYNRSVPSFDTVRRIVFREEPFPKTASGKILRPRL